MNTAAQIRAHGDVIELEGVDFFDACGFFAKDIDHAVTVRFKFIDGTYFEITPEEARKLDDYNFRLRPTDDDA